MHNPYSFYFLLISRYNCWISFMMMIKNGRKIAIIISLRIDIRLIFYLCFFSNTSVNSAYSNFKAFCKQWLLKCIWLFNSNKYINRYVWCRFFPESRKCITCTICQRLCHQFIKFIEYVHLSVLFVEMLLFMFLLFSK